MSPISKFWSAAAIVAVASVTAVGVSAYDLRPIVVQLTPSGAGSSQTMIINNSHQEPIAIEVRAYARTQLPNGDDQLTPDNDNIAIFPPQMVIQPGASQSFRVQWTGDPAIESERAYRIVTTQLPIRFQHATRGERTIDVSMRYRYEAALYVVPQGATPAVSLQSVTAVAGEGGAQQLELHIRSDGKTRAILEAPELEITPASGSAVTLTREQLGPLVGLNILPGVERVVRIAAPAGLPAGPLTGQLRTRFTTLR